MEKVKVAVVANMPPERARLLAGHAPQGFEVVFVDPATPDEGKLVQCRDADAIVLGGNPISVEVLRACPRVKLLQLLSAGYDRLDLKAIGELGIPLANNGGANAIAVAEQTLGLMLLMYRHLHLQWQNVKQRRWSQGLATPRFREITGKTVGIVGLGRIGKHVARRLLGFDCRVLYHDIVPMPPEVERELRVTRVPFEELLRESDIVTLHVPLTRLTRRMVSDRELALMKPTAVLVNACRGPVVDEAALYRALKAGRIAGAALDVLEEEPTPPENPLLDLDNVVVTPHSAGASHETSERGAAFAFANIQRVLRGEPPESLVVPEE